MWACPKCGEKVEADFQVCWSCGTSQEGIEDPDFQKEPDVTDVPSQEPMQTMPSVKPNPDKLAPCRACGSTKIIPNVEVLDQGDSSDGYLQVVLYGHPNAFIFRDRVYGKLRAWICGECGYTELRVINPKELYRKYLAAKERGEG